MSGGLETALIKAQNAVKRGEFAEAAQLYGAVVERFPRNARALRGLAQLRQVEAAAATPQAEADRLIGLYQRGQLAQVAAESEALVAKHPRSPMLYNILGAASIGLKDFAKAEAAFTQAAALDPDDAEIHNNHGIALNSQGKVDAALAAFDRALAIRPDYPEAHYNRGNALRKLQATAAAIAAYDRALTLKPDYVEACNNLGLAYQDDGQREAAFACYSRALAMKSDAPDVLHNLGNLLIELENFDGAIKAYGLALAIKPDTSDARGRQLYARAHVCDFSVHDDYRALKQQGALSHEIASPFTMLIFEDDAEHQLGYSRAWAGEAADRSAPAPRQKAPGERTKIGYFSADFHDHATLCLMAGLFREHDRQRFEIIAYSYGPEREGEMRAQLARNVDRLVDLCDMPDRDIVELVSADSLDIAIDLKGFTKQSRARLFAHRLAPVQVAYLGYPGSTGADYIDYLIADATVIPPGDERFYSEKIVTLPGSYQPNDELRPLIDSGASRADLGLPEGGFVFCCFNQNYKISAREFDIWMRLLARVEGSVLWLLRSNQWAEANLRSEAAARGVDPDRLIFAGALPHAEHLGRLRHADLFLDTFNVNAHTTASDALWAGLPVLTRIGRQFAARVGASLVRAVGLPELAVESEADYETLALELATTPALLGELRTRLAANRQTAPLFDTKRYTRQLEAAFDAIAQRHAAGLPPDHIAVT
jgi:predicted O-linked N-acetylglucosamine transferase (SPINDLY family)